LLFEEGKWFITTTVFGNKRPAQINRICRIAARQDRHDDKNMEARLSYHHAYPAAQRSYISCLSCLAGGIGAVLLFENLRNFLALQYINMIYHIDIFKQECDDG
jgi:hypothetical protein